MILVLFVFLSFFICSCSNSEQNHDADILPVEEVPADTLAADSLVVDTLEADTLEEKDSVPEDTIPEEIEEDTLNGMWKVEASGSVVTLGTDEKVRSIDRPKMKVKLEYDYYLGRHEVTCGDFNSLMKKATGLLLECEDDSLPATNLTYYDAILFANERSKAEGFDTAYTYVSANFDYEKHCVNLEGFAYRPDVDAYRLPTEAEWVFAANGNWDPKNAWTSDNSDYKLHPVCSRDSNPELCDMAGNAMEWVNDWMGSLQKKTVTNYVGAPDGGSLGQRIVKGGCYRNAASSITLYGRGDVYTVTSSTRSDYVGFRLAFGSILNATWMGDGGHVSESRVIPLANLSTIESLMETNKVKLAFRNDISGNLAYVDYSNGSLTVVEIADTIAVYHPEISPDGKRVAFCTGLEGISGKSAVYVRNLDAEGSGLVKLDVENAAIPRWRVLENGDTTIVFVTDAGNNKDESAFRSASTWQVTFANGQFGMPQKLFNGAYHGGISADDNLAVSGARLLRARVSGKDAVWYNSEQACNVSLAKDDSKRTLFLDFAGKTGRDFVGKRYATHERLLVADSVGKLIQSVAAPLGFSFDHSEWAGNSNFAVATLVDANGAHRKIALVNLSDSSIVELIEGDEVWHPSMWFFVNKIIDEKSDLDPDSAGVYLNSNGGDAAIILRYKMEYLWKYKDTANVVVLGSSRPMNGINPLLLSDEFFAINLSNVPNIMAVSDYLASHYVFQHVKNLKYLIVSLDIDFWYHDEFSSSNFFYEEYKAYPGYVYDESHDFWKDSVPEKLAEATENSMGFDYYGSIFKEGRGFAKVEPGSWEENPSVDCDSSWKDYYLWFYFATLQHLRHILSMAEEQGVYVIGVVFPQSPNFNKTGAWGRYGLRRSEAPMLLSDLESLEQEYPHFVFWDENKMGDHDYTDEMAANRDHLSYLGAVQLTARLDSLLKTLK